MMPDMAGAMPDMAGAEAAAMAEMAGAEAAAMAEMAGAEAAAMAEMAGAEAAAMADIPADIFDNLPDGYDPFNTDIDPVLENLEAQADEVGEVGEQQIGTTSAAGMAMGGAHPLSIVNLTEQYGGPAGTAKPDIWRSIYRTAENQQEAMDRIEKDAVVPRMSEWLLGLYVGIPVVVLLLAMKVAM